MKRFCFACWRAGLLLGLLSAVSQARPRPDLLAESQQVQVPAPENQPSAAKDAIPAVPDAADGNDPLLQPPPLPPGKPTLIGGIVGKIDRVKNDIVVKPYGGGSLKIYFDERTHIYRDGVETTQLGIHKGDRIYVDTLSDGSRILAKNIRVNAATQPADARGQLLAFNPQAGRLEMRDELTSQPVTFNVNNNTVIRRGSQRASAADLLPGSLVDVRFLPEAAGKGIAREITIFATPGSEFTFAGKISYLDMRTGLLALHNQSDAKDYEVHFDPKGRGYNNIGIGSEVTIQAVFDGRHYNARNLTLANGE
jgi:hypothetical protein